MRYVELSRRFHDLTQAELESPELLAHFSESSFRAGVDWAELLESPRVLLLAEAGSGKTVEMRNQEETLVKQGKNAFFIPIESLDRESLPAVLSQSPPAERAFAAWKANGETPAWFFLDAVDELKLTQGKLERALGRFASCVDGLLHRIHVVLSCRPSDWRSVVDMEVFEKKLPVPLIRPVVSPDDAFLAPLRVGGGGRKQDETKDFRTVRTVVLLPLGQGQIETFAESLGALDVPALIAELDRQDAWLFARRPLDLLGLVTVWNQNRRLGGRTEQHEENVRAKLKDDPERADQGILPTAQARTGAEQLALALALTRTRTIRSPEADAERTEGTLDPAEILRNWTPAQIKALLRRALFDPAMYGRVRFHHSSVQEYLAARRLQTLREKCMSVRGLRRLLFAERYGTPVVIPSMRTIATWLALWDSEVRRELLAREPEAMLSKGDPGALPIDARAQLLRAFAEAYGEGGRRGLDTSSTGSQRLADPRLAGVVRELWNTTPENPEVRELLLEIIGKGPIEDCADIAGAVAFDAEEGYILRILSIRALVACRKSDTLRQVGDSILQDPARWPIQVISAVIANLFPAALDAADLITLVNRSPSVRKGGTNISWVLRQVAETVAPIAETSIDLRDALAEAIWRARGEKQDWPRFTGRLNHIAPELAILCTRQLQLWVSGTRPDAGLVRASIVANRFDNDHAVANARLTKKYFETEPALREAAFWEELRLTSEAVPAENSWVRYSHALHYSLIEPLSEADRPWLLGVLRDSHNLEYQEVALHALLSLWNQNGRRDDDLDELLTVAAGHAGLTALIQQASMPPDSDDSECQVAQWKKKQNEWELAHRREEDERLAKWLCWKQDMLKNPENSFVGEQSQVNVTNLCCWLSGRKDTRTSYNCWDREAIQEAFGDEIATQAVKAFQKQWRTHQPLPWSKRHEDRSRFLLSWVEGLAGLAAEAADPLWAARLALSEARTAALYALFEINSFPHWLATLAASHPKVVQEVVGEELIAELAVADAHSHLPTLQNLTHADARIKGLLSSVLLAQLSQWPNESVDHESYGRLAHHLGLVIGILGDTLADQERVTAAATCKAKFVHNPSGPLALLWLKGFVRFAPEEGSAVIVELLSLPKMQCWHRAGAILSSIDRPVLASMESEKRAEMLGVLVSAAYRYVPVAEDQEHEGIYAPDDRDRAQETREFLLGSLLETSGAEAQCVVRDLAKEPLFDDLSDRLVYLARRRAASDAEGIALSADDIIHLETGLDAPPQDRQSFFDLMTERIDDLAEELANDDFTDRRTLRTIRDESEMQRTLARRLREKAKEAYKVTREEEVADRKRTDIRLVATRGEQRAVIEVKIADDRWSLRELELALRDQLVGQYLRSDTCRAGCLLLTYNGSKKRWKHLGSGRFLNFGQLLEWLRQVALEIERDSEFKVSLGVCGLDLRDPLLPG